MNTDQNRQNPFFLPYGTPHDTAPFDRIALEDFEEAMMEGIRRDDEQIEKIINTFKNREDVDDFSKVVSFEDITKKKYSFSAGQYFDIKIEYVDITEDEFNQRMVQHKENLRKMFDESHTLEQEIMEQLDKLKFNE